jgi:hypothetical protein
MGRFPSILLSNLLIYLYVKDVGNDDLSKAGLESQWIRNAEIFKSGLTDRQSYRQTDKQRDKQTDDKRGGHASKL